MGREQDISKGLKSKRAKEQTFPMDQGQGICNWPRIGNFQRVVTTVNKILAFLYFSV